MADPAANKENEINEEDEEKEENEEDYIKQQSYNSYFNAYKISYVISYNITKKIIELGLNDQNEVDIEIRGSKKEPTGISFEIFTFDKTKNNEFFDPNVEYIKEAEILISLNIELKEEEDLSTIKMIFDFFKEMVNNLPTNIYISQTLFRKNGKKISFDIIQKKNENEKKEENNNVSSNNYLNIGIKTGIELKQIFSENADHFKNLEDALSAIVNFKIKGTHLYYIFFYILEYIKYFKLVEGELTPMFEKIYEIINGIIIYLSKAELKLEYDAINLANEIVKEICLLFGKNEEDEFQKIVQEFIDKAKNVIKYVIDNDSLSYLIKKINLDCFSLNFVASMTQLGYATIIKIPGLNDFLTNL